MTIENNCLERAGEFKFMNKLIADPIQGNLISFSAGSFV
jgi:hypothetical protein